MEKTSGNALLLDDDKFLLDMYSLKFQREGFTVQACLSVNDAIEALRRGFAADVILFDLIMPDKDGFVFLETLRAEHLAEKAIKVALTNQSSDSEGKKATELGADHYIIKATMIPSEVVATVRKFMASSK